MNVEKASGKVVPLKPTVDRATLKKARLEFRRWKDTFTEMIRRKSSISWYRDPRGKMAYKFILPPDLFKVIYDIQINERVKAQLDHAQRQFKERGIVLPPRKEIEQQALKNLQREFMAASVSALEKICAAQQPEPVQEATKAPELVEEQAARETLARMRQHIAASGDTIDQAMENIKAEIEARNETEKSDAQV